MFEKVNPAHPDKVADRIAGAIVDLAYKKDDNPKVAVEVLIGHGECNVIIESSVSFSESEIYEIVERIAGTQTLNLKCVKQDEHLADNQTNGIRCGDNGIFKGCPITHEENLLTSLSKILYDTFHSDGKYFIDGNNITICQSNAYGVDIKKLWGNDYFNLNINPLGDWDGGTNVDCGATNRKLGSDMGGAVTGGGLHGKDLSKADVTLNIYCFLKANDITNYNSVPYELSCSIGDEFVDGKPYSEIVEIARKYINDVGGFEKFAEWGLIR